jgi:hypothetical protein
MRANMSYTKIGVFTLAAYPYSFKLLWSPLVDSLYFRGLGRRKSWILPLQAASAAVMIACGRWAEGRLEAGDAAGVTALFFALVMLAATQDIAVDGWALTLLSPRNVGYAATCQTVGMNIGYFTSFTVFLALSDAAFCDAHLRPGGAGGGALVSLSGYMRFWGWAYLAVTLAIGLFKAEGGPQARAVSVASGGSGRGGGARANGPAARHPRASDASSPAARHASPRRRSLRLAGRDSEGDGPGAAAHGHSGQEPPPLREAYAQLWRVVQLPSVRLLASLLMVARLGMLPAESAAALKLLEKGVSREALAGLVLIEFPIELASALVAGRWAAATHPLRPWLAGYRLRLALAGATTAAVWAFPAGAAALSDAPWAFAALAALGAATSFASTLMFTALGDFYNRISDPSMGGAYLTLLNTLANVGVVVPKLGVFALMDALTARRCVGGGAAAACGPASAGGTADGACLEAGGSCVVARDGFYVLSGVAVAGGAVLLAWIRRVLPRLEAMPQSAWRAAPKPRP